MKLPRRHRLEWLAYFVAILLVPLAFAAVIWLTDDDILGGQALFIGLALLLFAPFREMTRRSVHSNSVLLSRDQFPEVYSVVDDFSQKLNLQKSPDVYVTNGDGALNAFSSESRKKSFIVLNSELFSDQGESIFPGLAFVIGHELGHIKLKHTNFFYNIPLLPWLVFSPIPLLGEIFAIPHNVVSRFREYSCDRIGASLAPDGVSGLLLLAAGRYVYQKVDLREFLEQARSQETQGRWTGVAELFTTHPFLANRIKALYDRGLFAEPAKLADAVDQVA